MTGFDRRQVERFIADGFVRIDDAFPRALAEAGRARLWLDSGCDPSNRATWTRPVVWLGFYAGEPFRSAANTPVLHAAYDALVGPGRWLPTAGLGTFPVRFPSEVDSGDAGWHVDASFAGPESNPHDYLTWQVNVRSRGRALLLLFLLSDVGEDDAPTRIRVGSHHDVARALAPRGDAGLSVIELARAVADDVCARRREVLATGDAGTVYLCHPFLLHAAQRHRGHEPRFMAQPPLLPAPPGELVLERADGGYSAVEVAIRIALGLERDLPPAAQS